jgi:iron complex outermembrane receptor protein
MLIQPTLFSQNSDSVKIYYLDAVNVYAHKQNISSSEFPVDKDQLGSVLELGGFSIIRKGVFLAQDVYADGLKKGDIPIIVDGERYHNACPMRMDAPISRVNPLEVESIELCKSSCNLHSGLGGVVKINRSNPEENFNFRGSVTQSAGSLEATDLTLRVEKFNNRLSFRYAKGIPYNRADGSSFKDLYNYRDNIDFIFCEAGFNGLAGDWEYNLSFMYSGDITFPYLQMDERMSKVYNASLAYKDLKLYVNYTDHLMDNGLRVSNMTMTNDTENLTIGITSENYELFYRYWNAENSITPPNPMMQTINNMMPQVSLYSSRYHYAFKFVGLDISAKAGLNYFHIGNEKSLDFISAVHNGAKNDIFYPTLGLSISDAFLIADKFAISGMIDFAAEAPEAEVLFVNVKKMMNNPWWVGNPTLIQPMRTTLRTSISTDLMNVEFFGSYVFNYIYMNKTAIGSQMYLTYSNINALLAGIDLNFSYDMFDIAATYTYGNNETNNTPLIEIIPLQVITKVITPAINEFKFYLKHTYQNVQPRIDENLFETRSTAWNKLDIGLTGKLMNIILSIDVENVLNHNFSKQHSYVRDPFASNYRVYEPGRFVRVNLRYYTN